MISRIICKIRSDTERTVYLAFTIIEKMQSLLKVKCIAENNCFRPRINTQFLRWMLIVFIALTVLDLLKIISIKNALDNIL